jgi:hypothetical protein
MNVKKLMAELEKIENKFLEVEIYVQQDHKGYCELGSIGLRNSNRKKVLLFTRQEEK